MPPTPTPTITQADPFALGRDRLLEQDLARARAGRDFLASRVCELRDQLDAERRAHAATRATCGRLRERIRALDPGGLTTRGGDW